MNYTDSPPTPTFPRSTPPLGLCRVLGVSGTYVRQAIGGVIIGYAVTVSMAVGGRGQDAGAGEGRDRDWI